MCLNPFEDSFHFHKICFSFVRLIMLANLHILFRRGKLFDGKMSF